MLSRARAATTLTFVDEAEQDVLRPDVVLWLRSRAFLLREDHHPSGPVGETVRTRYLPLDKTCALPSRGAHYEYRADGVIYPR